MASQYYRMSGNKLLFSDVIKERKAHPGDVDCLTGDRRQHEGSPLRKHRRNARHLQRDASSSSGQSKSVRFKPGMQAHY